MATTWLSRIRQITLGEGSPRFATALNGLPVNEKGLVDCPETPGLGVDVNLDTVREYLQPVRIEVGGKLVHETPEV